MPRRIQSKDADSDFLVVISKLRQRTELDELQFVPKLGDILG